MLIKERKVFRRNEMLQRSIMFFSMKVHPRGSGDQTWAQGKQDVRSEGSARRLRQVSCISLIRISMYSKYSSLLKRETVPECLPSSAG